MNNFKTLFYRGINALSNHVGYYKLLLKKIYNHSERDEICKFLKSKK